MLCVVSRWSEGIPTWYAVHWRLLPGVGALCLKKIKGSVMNKKIENRPTIPQKKNAYRVLDLSPDLVLTPGQIEQARQLKHAKLDSSKSSSTDIEAERRLVERAAQLLLKKLSRSKFGRLSSTKMRDLPVPNRFRNKDDGNTDSQNLSETDGRSKHENSHFSLIGMVLGDRYTILQLLGTGGMGEVYKAYDKVRREEVALKILRRDLMGSSKSVKQIIHETQLASKLSHPRIVRVFDIHQTSDFSFLTMELLTGQTLRQEIQHRHSEERRFTAKELVQIGHQLSESLQYAHRQGVIHRDVKPENVWYQSNGSVKLMDFGIARLSHCDEAYSTRDSSGTAYYMAPEQRRGEKADARVDQYALGIVLYELLTGEPPQGAALPPHEFRPSVPSRISKAVMRSISSDPNRRFPNLETFARSLRGEAVNTFPTVRWLIAAVITIVALFGSVFWWMNSQSTTLSFPPKSSANTATKPIHSEVDFARLAAEVDLMLERGQQLEDKVFRSAEVARSESRRLEDSLRAVKRHGNQDEIAQYQARVSRQSQDCELAQRIADLWKDSEYFRKDWLVNAAGLTSSAKVLAANKNYDLAVRELTQAKKLVLDPLEWIGIVAKVLKDAEMLKTQLAEHRAGWSAIPGESGKDVELATTAQRLDEICRNLQSQDIHQLAKQVTDIAEYIDRLPELQITNSIGMKLRLIPPGEFETGETYEEVLRKHKDYVDSVRKRDAELGPLQGGTNSAWLKFKGSVGLLSSTEKEIYKGKEPTISPTRRHVRIASHFYLSAYEVTKEQFAIFAKETGYQTEAETNGRGGTGYRTNRSFRMRGERFDWRDNGLNQTDAFPVTNVSWNDAVAFCEWLTQKEGIEYRLPTWAEWEYACRGRTTTNYYHGDNPDELVSFANTAAANDGYESCAPVGSFRKNPFGLYDMLGNVNEWCLDRHIIEWKERGLVKEVSIDPRGPETGRKAYRGGSWYTKPLAATVDFDAAARPDHCYHHLGFRVFRAK